MPNFVDCWGALKAKGYKHADGSPVLNDADKASVMSRIQQHLKTGVDPLKAAKLSVQSHLDEAHAQLQSIYVQTVPKTVAGEQPKATVPAPENAPVQATGTGISSERFKEQYGDAAPVANTGKGPSEWKQIGQSRLDDFQKSGSTSNDPYSVLTNLREGKVPVNQIASDVSLLRAEHQRLLEDARNSEGTPQYAGKSQAALDMATAIKEVAHGPASDIMRSLQEHDAPRYDNVTDFDQAIRERLGRESTPSEKTQFERIINDRVRTQDVAGKEIDAAQQQVQRYRGREKMSFEDAAKDIHDQIEKLTKDCV